MKKTKIVFVLLFAITSFKPMMGQSAQKEPQFYNWFDNQVHRYNTGLFNGIEYIELYRTINELHKFFESSEFLIGSLVYDGQFYDQVPLKYDLDSDELLFNVGYNYRYPTLILVKSKVASFSFGEHHFIQVNQSGEATETTGFYEELLVKGPITLLKKNMKKRFKRIRGTTVYYEFEHNDSYLAAHQGTYYDIDSKKDILKIWPEKRTFINENFNPALRKTNEDAFWVSFFSKLADSFDTGKEEIKP